MGPWTPIDDALGAIRTALTDKTRLVLCAPPGAGKTTRLPIALLDETWLAGRRILILEPRRIAARLAAERMASTLGGSVGDVVGLSTRIERRLSARTRIEVVTDGLLVRRLIAEPELPDVGAILFDEFHERSLAADLGLALARDVQEALRPDLRIVVMSATLDAADLAARLDAPQVISEGRSHPVETIYLGRSEKRIEDAMAAAVRRALRERAGSILAFLPGQREILRTLERLDGLPADVDATPLFGALSPGEQDAAVAPARAGRRKIVLATDIAESSLTISGVDIVIDSGLARVAEYDPGVGVALSTVRASRASIDQRRGRAGRERPGTCYRLWDASETRGLPAAPTPEIILQDLSSLALALAEWGVMDAATLAWIDMPPPGRLDAARNDLRALGALDADHRLTELGREIARLPLEPRLAAMIAQAQDPADRALAAEIAATLSERGLGGASADLVERIERLRADRSPRAEAMKRQAARWSGAAGRAAPAADAGRILARADWRRIARARADEPGAFLMAGGRAARLDPADPLAANEWLAVAETTGGRAGARILLAARLSASDALSSAGVETVEKTDFDWDAATLRARRIRRLGAIALSESPLPAPRGPKAAEALCAALRAAGLARLPAAPAIDETLARLALARAYSGAEIPEWSEAGLLETLEEWLAPLLGDPPALDKPRPPDVREALLARLDWPARRAVESLAPLTFQSPAGHALPIDYLAEGGPRVEARVQEFYGLAAHPAIAGGRAPLTLSLLSPARRQIAVTRDIVAFWRGGYRDMAKDMRGRYPKHDWPDDPAAARPHEGRTKARL